MSKKTAYEYAPQPRVWIASGKLRGLNKASGPKELGSSLLLLVCLVDHAPNNGGWFHLSLARIESETGLSQSTIKRSRQRLTDGGFIQSQPGIGRRHATEWKLNTSKEKRSPTEPLSGDGKGVTTRKKAVTTTPKGGHKYPKSGQLVSYQQQNSINTTTGADASRPGGGSDFSSDFSQDDIDKLNAIGVAVDDKLRSVSDTPDKRRLAVRWAIYLTSPQASNVREPGALLVKRVAAGESPPSRYGSVPYDELTGEEKNDAFWSEFTSPTPEQIEKIFGPPPEPKNNPSCIEFWQFAFGCEDIQWPVTLDAFDAEWPGMVERANTLRDTPMTDGEAAERYQQHRQWVEQLGGGDVID